MNAFAGRAAVRGTGRRSEAGGLLLGSEVGNDLLGGDLEGGP